jgi:hypothetical protein
MEMANDRGANLNRDEDIGGFMAANGNFVGANFEEDDNFGAVSRNNNDSTPGWSQDQTAQFYDQRDEASFFENAVDFLGFVGPFVNPAVGLLAMAGKASVASDKGYSPSYIGANALIDTYSPNPVASIAGRAVNESAHGLDPSKGVKRGMLSMASNELLSPDSNLEALGMNKVMDYAANHINEYGGHKAPTNELNTLTQNNAMDQEVSAATDGAFTTGGLAPRPIETAMAFEDRPQHRNPINRSRQRGFS